MINRSNIRSSAALSLKTAQCSETHSGLVTDNRPAAVIQRQQHEMAVTSERTQAQKRDFAKAFTGGASTDPQPEHTGLPTDLKTGLESLSGLELSDVNVFYNSARPAKLHALAYARGNEIHLAPGQEKNLSHEGWHIVQQKQGRVKPSLQTKSGEYINNDSNLEREADIMGAKAWNMTANVEPRKNLKFVGMPAGNAPVQGRFIWKTRVLTVEEVKKMLTDETVQLLQKVTQGANVDKVLKKLAEGPDIFLSDDLSNLESETLSRLGTRADMFMNKEAGKPLRKLNRIAGQLQAKSAKMQEAPGWKQISPAIILLVKATTMAFTKMPGVDEILKICQNALQAFLAVSEMDSRRMWLLYDLVSHLGPLGYWLIMANKGKPQDYPLYTENLSLLRDIRQEMARRDTIGIVAHRGTGPTNRTFGGLISDDDNRRMNRPAENSPQAFAMALSEATRYEGRGMPGLDGVECDVFLDKDNVVMLSHEGKIREQLNAAQKEIQKDKVRDNTIEIHDLGVADLMAIQRNEHKMSRFMTLAELLNMVHPVAKDFYEITGRPFRVEIEMKDSHADIKTLTNAVAKVVSRAIKNNAGVPVEYILFNGKHEQVKGFSELRIQKSALGGLYTGINAKESNDTKDVDELRYAFSDALDMNKLASNKGSLPSTEESLKRFIVTLVPSQEFVPLEHPEFMTMQPSEPSKDVPVHGQLTKVVKRTLDRRKQHMDDNDTLIQEIIAHYAMSGKDISKLHVLTDYPKKAYWMKDELFWRTYDKRKLPWATYMQNVKSNHHAVSEIEALQARLIMAEQGGGHLVLMNRWADEFSKKTLEKYKTEVMLRMPDDEFPPEYETVFNVSQIVATYWIRNRGNQIKDDDTKLSAPSGSPASLSTSSVEKKGS